MNEEKTVHEAVEVARLDAAKFVINHFAKEAKKPKIYDAAVAYIEKALIDLDEVGRKIRAASGK